MVPQAPEDDLREALDQHVGGGRVRPSHGQGRYGVVPPKAPDIMAICAPQIRLPQHTIGLGHCHQMQSASLSRVMTTTEACKVGVFILGK